MRVRVDSKKVFETRWYEYAIRFALGGLITVVAGLITKQWGPVVGGLFLAFPAIFPAGATLIEKHEREHKEIVGLSGTMRARRAAGADAAGAAMGACGLVAFSVIAWKLLPILNPAAVLAIASAGWMAVSAAMWRIRKSAL